MPKKLKLDQLKVKSFVTVLEDKNQKDNVKGGVHSVETNCFNTCIPQMCDTNEFQTCGGTCYYSHCGNCGGGTNSCNSCGETCDAGFQCAVTIYVC